LKPECLWIVENAFEFGGAATARAMQRHLNDRILREDGLWARDENCDAGSVRNGRRTTGFGARERFTFKLGIPGAIWATGDQGLPRVPVDFDAGLATSLRIF
jgi:hypothetical protein